MPNSGWYPDPDGTPNRYRYWDGATWSESTSTDPRQPAPRAGVNPERRRGPNLALVIAVLAVLVIVVVAGVMIFRDRQQVRPYTNDPVPSSTVSGWDDSSPTATPSATVSPSPSASPTPSDGGQVPCDLGQPDERLPHPSDGRVQGGNLSFVRASIFDAEQSEPRFSFAYDVVQQTLEVNKEPGWIAQLAVGQLRAADGFGPTAKAAVHSLADCAISSDFYQPYVPNRHDKQSVAVTVDGRAGWMIRTDVTVDAPGLPFAGDDCVFIVVPDGADYGFFFGAVPIGNGKLGQSMQAAVDSLQIS